MHLQESTFSTLCHLVLKNSQCSRKAAASTWTWTSTVCYIQLYSLSVCLLYSSPRPASFSVISSEHSCFKRQRDPRRDVAMLLYLTSPLPSSLCVCVSVLQPWAAARPGIAASHPACRRVWTGQAVPPTAGGGQGSMEEALAAGLRRSLNHKVRHWWTCCLGNVAIQLFAFILPHGQVEVCQGWHSRKLYKKWHFAKNVS